MIIMTHEQKERYKQLCFTPFSCLSEAERAERSTLHTIVYQNSLYQLKERYDLLRVDSYAKALHIWETVKHVTPRDNGPAAHFGEHVKLGSTFMLKKLRGNTFVIGLGHGQLFKLYQNSDLELCNMDRLMGMTTGTRTPQIRDILGLMIEKDKRRGVELVVYPQDKITGRTPYGKVVVLNPSTKKYTEYNDWYEIPQDKRRLALWREPTPLHRVIMHDGMVYNLKTREVVTPHREVIFRTDSDARKKWLAARKLLLARVTVMAALETPSVIIERDGSLRYDPERFVNSVVQVINGDETAQKNGLTTLARMSYQRYPPQNFLEFVTKRLLARSWDIRNKLGVVTAGVKEKKQ